VALVACSPAEPSVEPSVPLVEVPADPGAPSTHAPKESHTPGDAAPAPAPEIAWLSDIDTALSQARAKRRTVVVFVFAEWNLHSKEMDHRVWSDERVRRAARRLVPLRVDLTDANGGSDALLDRFGVASVPAVVLIDAREQRIAKLEGPVTVDSMLEFLARAP
jgi:thiol:disulfide interchange protein